MYALTAVLEKENSLSPHDCSLPFPTLESHRSSSSPAVVCRVLSATAGPRVLSFLYRLPLCSPLCGGNNSILAPSCVWRRLALGFFDRRFSLALDPVSVRPMVGVALMRLSWSFCFSSGVKVRWSRSQLRRVWFAEVRSISIYRCSPVAARRFSGGVMDRQWWVGFFAVSFLYMSSRFKGCIRSRKVRFSDGNLQVCFLNDGIVAWRFFLMPSVVRLSGLVVRSCFDSPSRFVLGWVVGICRNRSF
ncbi:hypothetical protein F2Q69_00060083 [Brassica cretica]|uniref:Uncharacterized protein n=1 Tax=Brassica cretica TaxID=69181 RepID=A0A8S9RH93_BRACR|nr:hypothetical protein F2Q69_00060083 [Brassica cretica]